MLSGHALFRGTAGEVMYQHLHATIRKGQLGQGPQPAVVVLEVLMEKNPARRFQNPAEMLTALAAVTGAIDGERIITRQSLQQISPVDSLGATRKLPTTRGPEKISVARLPITPSMVFGREEDLAFLDTAWAHPQENVLSFVASARGGKSQLVTHGPLRQAARQHRLPQLVCRSP